MGQYYKLVNVDKHEYVEPWPLGGIAKFVEWCTCPHALVIPYLIGLCNGHGGGDIQPEGKKYLGRWAGNRIMLVGDYFGDGEKNHPYAHLYFTVSNNDMACLQEDIDSLKKTDLNTNSTPERKKERQKELKELEKKLADLKAHPERQYTDISKELKAEYEEEFGKDSLNFSKGIRPMMSPDMMLGGGRMVTGDQMRLAEVEKRNKEAEESGR